MTFRSLLPAFLATFALLAAGGCKTKQADSALRDEDGDLTSELPPETLHNLVLQWGMSPKLSFTGGASWTKFVVTLADDEVYIMDASQDSFHYEFAVKNIPAFRTSRPHEFDAATLQNEGRIAVSGGIINLNGVWGFDLISDDPLDHDFAIKIMKAVRSRIFSDSELQFSYLPAFNQTDSALLGRSKYEQAGFPLRSRVELSPATQVYSNGWAFGRLVQVDHDKIDAEFAAGRLKPTDILLTNGIPAEIPVLAGVITNFPATPNSHVAILAASFQIPFAYTRDEALVRELQGLIGKEILVKVKGSTLYGSLTLKPIDLTRADRTALATLKDPVGLRYPEKKSYKAASGKIYKSVQEMQATDAQYFGGKALNLKVLATALPGNAPTEGIGLSFDVWDEFLDTAKVDGQTVRSYVEGRLRGTTYPPADMQALKVTLAEIREKIKDAKFPNALRLQIVEALQTAGFATDKKIRFRSSTNVEDGESFSGAGLYDSFSGCLGDELEEPQVTRCAVGGTPDSGEPEDNKPKKVTKAIRKVFASFYNDNAFLERIRRGVDPGKVGMAIAVHYSFDDTNELANGVITTSSYEDTIDAQVVSQVGAESITNPSAESGPEIAGISVAKDDTGQPQASMYVQSFSRRLPTGKLVLGQESLYQELGVMIAKVHQAYVGFHASDKPLALDMEYKLIKDGESTRLIIKQVRTIPQAPKTTKYYVLGRKIPLCLVQAGSFGDAWPELMGRHALKGSGHIQTRSGWLDALVRRRDFISSGSLEFVKGADKQKVDLNRLRRVESRLDSDDFGSKLRHVAEGQASLFGDSHALTVTAAFPLDPDLPVILSGQPSNALGSSALMFTVGSKNSRTAFAGTGQDVAVDYFACDENLPMAEETVRTGSVGSVKVSIGYKYSSSTFYKQEQNLAEWTNVIIEGLTSSPLEIKHNSARTYAAGHHNFHELFFFEPALDPAIGRGQQAELRQKDIKAILVERLISDELGVRLIGFDDRVRKADGGPAFVSLPLPGGEGDNGGPSDGGPVEGGVEGGEGPIDFGDVFTPEGVEAPQGLIGF